MVTLGQIIVVGVVGAAVCLAIGGSFYLLFVGAGKAIEFVEHIPFNVLFYVLPNCEYGSRKFRFWSKVENVFRFITHPIQRTMAIHHARQRRFV